MCRTAAIVFAALTLAVLCAGRPATACVQLPRALDYAVENGPQRGLVLWDNGRQEMVLMPGYALGANKAGARPDLNADGLVAALTSLVWVIPLPEVPESFGEAGLTVFKDLHEFTTVRPRLAELKSEDGPAIAPESEGGQGMQFPAARNLGDYQLHVIKTRGEAGAAELRKWLRDNGHAEPAEDALRWYAQRQWCWLVARLNSARGLPDAADLKPLRLSFATPRPVFPLKLCDGRGAFDAEIWVITREKLDPAKLRPFGFAAPEQDDDYYLQENRETGFTRLPESVQELCRDSEELKGLRLGTIWCWRLSARNLEARNGQDVGSWLDDLQFALERDSTAKPEREARPTPEEKPGEKPGDRPDDKGADQGEKAPGGK